jgi:hypothetical protein
MEIVSLVFSAENMRMLVLLAFGTCGFVWLKSSLLKEMRGEMDERFKTFYEHLKTNDFKHLNDTIEALTLGHFAT